jgi:fatty aldehyde decarbonylase
MTDPISSSVTTPQIPALPPRDHYLKLLSFVVSNAWAGERMAVDNYSEIVPLLPTTDQKIQVVHQARDESKHILVLEKLARHIGFSVDELLIQREWDGVRSAFHDAAGRGDLAGCLIIQDLMVESLAIGLYSTFASSANGDRETAKTAAQLLDDERRHLEIGVRGIRELLERDPDGVHDSLVWAHNRVMPCLFTMVHNACDFLCSRNIYCKSDMAYVEGGALFLDGRPKGDEYLNLESLKVAALEHYVEMLHTTGFEGRVANPLIASMSAYEVREASGSAPA